MILKPNSVVKPNLSLLDTYVDPQADLDWRWRLVRSMVSEDIRPMRKHDRWIVEGFEFSSAIAKSTNNIEREIAAKTWPAINRALSVRNGDGQQSSRWQALSLCTDLSLQDQAAYLNARPEDVVAYEKLFFDIRGNRENKGYMCTLMSTPAALREADNSKDPGLAWKILLTKVKVSRQTDKDGNHCWSITYSSPNDVKKICLRLGSKDIARRYQ